MRTARLMRPLLPEGRLCSRPTFVPALDALGRKFARDGWVFGETTSGGTVMGVELGTTLQCGLLRRENADAERLLEFVSGGQGIRIKRSEKLEYRVSIGLVSRLSSGEDMTLEPSTEPSLKMNDEPSSTRLLTSDGMWESEKEPPPMRSWKENSVFRSTPNFTSRANNSPPPTFCVPDRGGNSAFNCLQRYH